MTNMVIVENRSQDEENSVQPSPRGSRIAGSCRVLRQLLDKTPSVSLVITEATLPDGNWSTVVREVVVRGLLATVVVCSRRPSESLRQEALQRGAAYTVGDPERVAAGLDRMLAGMAT